MMPSSYGTIPSNKATYLFFIVLFLNWACKFWCTSLVFAISNSPEVDISSRCTIMGPVAAGYRSRIRRKTESALFFPGTESHPSGLFITSRYSSSYTISSSVPTPHTFDKGFGSTFKPCNIYFNIGPHFPLHEG